MKIKFTNSLIFAAIVLLGLSASRMLATTPKASLTVSDTKGTLVPVSSTQGIVTGYAQTTLTNSKGWKQVKAGVHFATDGKSVVGIVCDQEGLKCKSIPLTSDKSLGYYDTIRDLEVGEFSDYYYVSFPQPHNVFQMFIVKKFDYSSKSMALVSTVTVYNLDNSSQFKQLMIVPNPESDETSPSFMFVASTGSVAIKLFTKVMYTQSNGALVRLYTFKVQEDMAPIEFTLNSKYQVLSVDYVTPNQLGLNCVYFQVVNPWGGDGNNIINQQTFTFSSMTSMEPGASIDAGIASSNNYNFLRENPKKTSVYLNYQPYPKENTPTSAYYDIQTVYDELNNVEIRVYTQPYYTGITLQFLPIIEIYKGNPSSSEVPVKSFEVSDMVYGDTLIGVYVSGSQTGKTTIAIVGAGSLGGDYDMGTETVNYPKVSYVELDLGY